MLVSDSTSPNSNGVDLFGFKHFLVSGQPIYSPETGVTHPYLGLCRALGHLLLRFVVRVWARDHDDLSGRPRNRLRWPAAAQPQLRQQFRIRNGRWRRRSNIHNAGIAFDLGSPRTAASVVAQANGLGTVERVI